MKTVQGFNYITTPDDWKNAVRNYQDQSISELQEKLREIEANSQKGEDSKNVQLQENVESEEQTNDVITKRVRRPLRTILIAAAIIVLSCGSVVAFDGISGNYNLEVTRIIWGLFTGENSNHTQGINQSVTDGGVKVTCSNVIAQDDKLCFQINVKTIDGSNFCDTVDQENDLANIQIFEKMQLYVDGVKFEDLSDNYSHGYTRVDDKTVPDQAEFELIFTGQKKEEGIFLNKEIELKLDGIANYHFNTRDIEITSTSLADLFTGVILAKQEDMELYPKTLRGENVDVPKLPEGNLHIPFSAQYPDCYIDNAAIGTYTMHDHQTGEERKRSVFYIAITVANDDEYMLMRDLVCMNTQNGEIPSINLSSMGVIQDNRIILMLAPYKDPYFPSNSDSTAQPIEFTGDMFSLYNLICLKQQSREATTLYRGEWDFHLTVDESLISEPKTAENVDVITEKGKLHIDKLSLKNLSIEMAASLDYTGFVKDASYKKIALVHSDGSVTDYHAAPTGSIECVNGNIQINNVELKWTDGKVCDTSNVVAVRLLGKDIPVE